MNHGSALFCGPEPFKIEPPSPAHQLEVDAADFGIRTHPDFCNGKAFAEAIQYCKQVDASRLIVPKGVYHFHSGEHLSFEQLRHFVFDGQGSEFIFSTVRNFVEITGCEHSVFRNFTIDWDWQHEPLARIGKIVHVEKDFSFFDLQFPEDAEVPENMHVRTLNPINPATYTPGIAGGVEFNSASLNGQTKINANTLRIFTDDKARVDFLQAGQCYIVRHYVYDAHGLSVVDNKHLSLEHVTVYSSPGHAILARGHQHHWQLVHCRLKKRPGTTRCISATADGCHISNSLGYFRMEYCDFSYCGDDCLNIHDNAITGLRKTDAHTLVAGNAIPWRNPFHPGDPVEFRNRDLSPMNITLKVSSVEWNAENMECTLRFSDALPESLPQNTILFNRAYDSGNYIVRHNFFHQNRARGILIHANNGLIEENHFYLNQGSAIRLECGVEERWSEGFGIDNLVIRNNLIESCDCNHWHMAVVYLSVYLPEGRTRYPIFTRILFEDNTIVNCPQQAFFLSSCKDVTVRNNAIINPNALPVKADTDQLDGNRVTDRYLYRGTIMTSYCQDVVISGNQRLETIPTSDHGIYVDQETAVDVIVSDNKGFDK